MRSIALMVFSLLSLVMADFCRAEEFPLRKNYPDVTFLELSAVKAGYDNKSMILVDVRSRMEFDTIHPLDAVHVDFSHQNFLLDLRKVVQDNPGKKIVLYDNGITCLKCYIGAQDALDEGLNDIYAFDGGIPAWAEAYPAETLLMGKVIDDPGKQLIPYEEFKKVCLDFATFQQKVKSAKNAVVIDARDPMQRKQKLPGFENALPIPLDKLIRNVIDKDNMKDKQLFIFDQVGRQARWLMYYLAARGYRDYYFLDGGATSVLKEQEYR